MPFKQWVHTVFTRKKRSFQIYFLCSLRFLLLNAFHGSNAKIFFQSFFILMTVPPFLFPSALQCLRECANLLVEQALATPVPRRRRRRPAHRSPSKSVSTAHRRGSAPRDDRRLGKRVRRRRPPP